MNKFAEKIFVVFSIFLLPKLTLGQGIDSFIANQVQSQVSRQISAGVSKNLNENLLIPQLNIRNNAGKIKDFSLSQDDRYFNVLHQDGTLRIWDTKHGVQRPTINGNGNGFNKVVSSSLTGTAMVASTDGKIYIYDILTAKLISQLDNGSSESISALALAKSDNMLAAAYADGKIVIWDVLKYQKVVVFDSHFANELTELLFTNTDKSLLISTKEGKNELWNVEKLAKQASLPAQSGRALAILESPNADLIFANSSGELQWITPPGNQASQTKKISTANAIISASLNTTGSILSLASNAKKIQFFNLPDLTLIKDIPTSQSVNYLHFLKGGKRLLGADDNGVLHVWDIALATELMQLISTNTGWTVIDNAGRFDSSEGGMANVSWQAADKDIPLDNFSGNYYEPDLLATQLNNDSFINPNPQQIQAGIHLPPEISLNAPATGNAGEQIEVSFDIADTGGGIADQNLYQNGKIIDPSLLEDSNDSEVNGIPHKKISYKLSLLPGNNRFKALATNKMGIESMAPPQIVQATGGEKQADLYVLVIGINKYSDKNLDLSYSVQDAQSIVTTLGNKNASSFKNIYTFNLLDQDATKEAITAKFKNIAENTKPNDVLIVYFAGHGIAVKGQWYFLPHETSFHAEEEYYPTVGISAKQIQSLIAKIPAEKVLVMFDSCYSGSGIKVFEDLKKTQRHFSRTLSKTDGIVVLAATRKDQEALELAELGHGLFTYIVNKGMVGAADLRPHDQNISAHEVVNYVSETIPTYTHKYVNASQEPTSFTIGDDFLLLGY